MKFAVVGRIEAGRISHEPVLSHKYENEPHSDQGV